MYSRGSTLRLFDPHERHHHRKDPVEWISPGRAIRDVEYVRLDKPRVEREGHAVATIVAGDVLLYLTGTKSLHMLRLVVP